MKKIKLTQNEFALVDNNVYEKLNRYKWCVHKRRGIFYASRGVTTTKYAGIKGIHMHRVIMGVIDPKLFVDHINGDGLDNRKKNLRICTNAENARNAKAKTRNRSGYKGVSLHRINKDGMQTWRSRICMDGKDISLGVYRSKREAARAYNTAAIKMFGRFAKVNSI